MGSVRRQGVHPRTGKRIETRLFVRHQDGDWGGYSYEWRDAQTDAELRPRGQDQVEIEGQPWLYPSSAQCLRCHTEQAGRTLGLEFGQLNGLQTYPSGVTAHQITTLDKIGMLAAPLPAAVEALPRLPDPLGADPLESRAKSYLHTNCSFCHQPGGTGLGDADYRYATPFASMKICGVAPTQDDFVGDADPFLFCVHHDDAYPAGNERSGPRRRSRAATSGRTSRARRLAHVPRRRGARLPAAPAPRLRDGDRRAPGLIDHSDSLGRDGALRRRRRAVADRGRGIVHAEMFPLVDRDAPNPLELFQIWLNLPARRQDGRAALHDALARQHPGPRRARRRGPSTEVTVIAGQLGDVRAPAPPPALVGGPPRQRRRHLDDQDGARRPLDLPPACARHQPHALLLPRQRPARRRTARLPSRAHGDPLRPTPRPRWSTGGESSAELLLLQGRPSASRSPSTAPS
jgi:hypothetical protein